MSTPTMTINEWLRANVAAPERSIYRTDLARMLGVARNHNMHSAASKQGFTEPEIASAFNELKQMEWNAKGGSAFHNGDPIDANPYRECRDKDAASEWAMGWVEAKRDCDSYDFSWRSSA